MQRPVRRRGSFGAATVLLMAAAFCAPRAAQAKKMTLDELLDMARTRNPGIAAAGAATAAVEAQTSEARRNWLPQGDLLSLLAPSPNIHCRNLTGDPDPARCVTTTDNEATISNVAWTKVFTRTEVRLIQPIWDFGKISAGVAA